jgi:DNA-binding NarL/FixJ family response regulator
LNVTRVLIVDDERLFRGALELILSAQQAIEVVGQARTDARRSSSHEISIRTLS